MGCHCYLIHGSTHVQTHHIISMKLLRLTSYCASILAALNMDGWSPKWWHRYEPNTQHSSKVTALVSRQARRGLQQEETATTSFSHKLESKVSTTSLSHKLQPQASTISLNHKFQPQTWVTNFNHKLQNHKLQSQSSTTSFNQKLQPQASATSFNQKLQF